MTTIAVDVTPVGPRNLGERFMYRGPFYAPKTCVVVERYEHEKEMRDGTVLFADHTTTSFFDWDLHSLDCPGTMGHVSKREPCPCGAWPGDPQHKSRRLTAAQKRIMGKIAEERGELVVHIHSDGSIDATSGPEHPHTPMEYPNP